MKNQQYFIILILFFTFTGINCDENKNDKLTAFSKSINYENQKKYDLALSEIEKIKNSYSNDYFTNLRLGWLYYNNKRYTESIQYYNRAFGVSGNKSIEALLGLTYPYDALSKTDELLNIYKRILELDNNNYTANLQLGIIYYYKKNYPTAKNYLDRVYANYSSDYSANLYLGWTMLYLKNKSKAKEYFIYALINKSDDSSAKEGLAACD